MSPSRALTFLLPLIALLLTNIYKTTNIQLITNNLKLLLHPDHYHGTNVKGPFFEGWYYKTVLPNASGSIIFIPGVFLPSGYNPESTIPDNEDEMRKRLDAHGFVMLIQDLGNNATPCNCLYYRYPLTNVSATGEPDGGYTFKIGDSIFSDKSMTLDLDSKYLVWNADEDLRVFAEKTWREYGELYKDDAGGLPLPDVKSCTSGKQAVVVKGHVSFVDSVKLPSTTYIPTVMGPFAYNPLMECYHGIVNLFHRTKGTIKFFHQNNNKIEEVNLNTGHGYIEKDHGTNFPTSWVWIQSSSFRNQMGSALLVSIAHVPLLSSDGFLATAIESIPGIGRWIIDRFHFPGFLIVFYDKRSDTTYNLSLYTGSTVRGLRFGLEKGENGRVVQVLRFVARNFWENVEMKVEARRELGGGVPLPGPRDDKMRLIVEETVQGSVNVELMVDGEVVFDGVGEVAGMEVSGDVKKLMDRM